MRKAKLFYIVWAPCYVNCHVLIMCPQKLSMGYQAKHGIPGAVVDNCVLLKDNLLSFIYHGGSLKHYRHT